jgi:hypothetical protein
VRVILGVKAKTKQGALLILCISFSLGRFMVLIASVSKANIEGKA